MFPSSGCTQQQAIGAKAYASMTTHPSLSLNLYAKHASKMKEISSSNRRETKRLYGMNCQAPPKTPLHWAWCRDAYSLNQTPPCVKLSYMCEVKILKAQEATMSLEIDTMLFNETTELDLGNKGFFTYALLFPPK